MDNQTERFCLLVKGQVQGVGFRPWIFRTAKLWPLTGFVRNDTAGVIIEVQGKRSDIQQFISAIRDSKDAPPLSHITEIESETVPVIPQESSFVIDHSNSAGQVSVSVTPDTAVCQECLDEMHDESDFRYNYPFINCTNCGPRYTIIKSIPYDRPNTTMSDFAMCKRCSSQYRDISNRRFHAQPVACPSCGPYLWLTDANGIRITDGDKQTVTAAVKLLMEGKILAIKGIGGFHLAADARNEESVRLLRQRKHRDHKPFAMMAASVETIRRFAIVSAEAHSILSCPQSPIVLLPQKRNSGIASSIAKGTLTYGFMLPYAPLHHMLFDQSVDGRKVEVLVMTSANIADQPLVCRNDEAVTKLRGIADFFLMHDRDIFRQIDDSIVHFVNHTPVPIRRARGYVPSPVICSYVSQRPVLAAGSDLKNTFCLVRDGQFIISEHIGDLEDADVYRHYKSSIRHMSGLFDFEPSVVVADLHPGYFSTQYAQSLKSVDVIQVQHHWAHIASVLAENNMTGPVIGIAADGTGFGTDGAIWGCECLIASLADFRRFGHLKYFNLAGGDKSSKEAVRPLAALLRQLGTMEFDTETLGHLGRIEPDEARLATIIAQLQKKINTIPTSSLGRVFDAAAALLGLGVYNHFEAQLPMALEAVADAGCSDNYDFTLLGKDPLELDLEPIFKAILNDIKAGLPVSVIAARFHNTIAKAFAAMAAVASKATGIKVVALSGGVFCNRLLADRTISLLQNEGFSVLYNTVVPANDGGLALGQAAIAAYRYRK